MLARSAKKWPKHITKVNPKVTQQLPKGQTQSEPKHIPKVSPVSYESEDK